ncbi:MAG: hypothetical protein J0I12_16960 [Candidatus Eremiobacteraeota bacterium]|nr:hypothetical protein [Candidatus Eremiobacteraeota bacterium]
MMRAVLTAFAVLVCAFVCLLFVNPRGIKTRAQGQLIGCKVNCKNLATALDMYATDNKGRYPVRIHQLIRGKYLKEFPICPAAGSDTYRKSYQIQRSPDRFSFLCQGNNHPKAYAGFSPPFDNFPQYSSEMGLLDHP